MTEKQFLRIWAKVFQKRQTDIYELWKTNSFGQYSELICGKNNANSIAMELNNEINKTNTKICLEYSSCDTVYFYKRDSTQENKFHKFIGLEKHQKKPRKSTEKTIYDIQIHFGSEHNHKTSVGEIENFYNNIGKINVLVTYPNGNDKCLNTYEYILKEIFDLKKFLLIVCYYTEQEKILWKSYVWNRKKKKLEEIFLL